MSVKNDILNQVLTDAKFITITNGYTIEVPHVYKGYLPLSIDNSFNRVCAWFGPQDAPGTSVNSNMPVSRVADLNIDFHGRNSSAGTGEGKVDELIDLIELNMFKWLFEGSGITANKWCTFDRAGISGVSENCYTLGNIAYTRDDEQGIVVVQFQLKVLYSPQF